MEIERLQQMPWTIFVPRDQVSNPNRIDLKNGGRISDGQTADSPNETTYSNKLDQNHSISGRPHPQPQPILLLHFGKTNLSDAICHLHTIQ